MKQTVMTARLWIVRVVLFPWLALIMYAGFAHAATRYYTLENILLADDTQVNGAFSWTYTIGDFENGVGRFIYLDIPYTIHDHTDLDATIDVGQSIEITLEGSVHDDGVDISLVLLQPLTPTTSSSIDPSLSKYEIGGNGFHDGFFQSGGSVAPVVQSLVLPSSVTVVESAGSGYCESSWYVNQNELNFFRSFTPCEAGLAVLDPGPYLDTQGKEYTELFAFMTRNIKETTVLELAWPQPVESVLIRVCTGCNDAFTVADKVDVSADGFAWERLTCIQTNSSRAAQGEPGSVLYAPDQDAQRRFGIAECFWRLPAAANTLFIRGVESDVSEGTSIASVEGLSEAPAISATVDDMLTLFAICSNRSTGVSVPLSGLGGATSWDCTAAGLVAGPGDAVLVGGLGIASCGPQGSCNPGGSIGGMTGNFAQCRNLSSGQSVFVVLAGGAWNCEDAGFIANTGDLVLQFVAGNAGP